MNLVKIFKNNFLIEHLRTTAFAPPERLRKDLKISFLSKIGRKKACQER